MFGIKETKTEVAIEAAAAFTRVFPIRIVARRSSTLAAIFRTSFAFLLPVFSRCLSLYGVEDIKAVSDDEKNALRRRKRKKRIKDGSNISGI